MIVSFSGEPGIPVLHLRKRYAEKSGFICYLRVIFCLSGVTGGSSIATIPESEDFTKSGIRPSVNEVLQSMILLL